MSYPEEVERLLAFLRARLDEDEAVARAALDGPWIGGWERAHLVDWVIYGQSRWPGHLGQVCNVELAHEPRGCGEHIARHAPDRVLREVEAKRRRVGYIEALYAEVSSDDAVALLLIEVEPYAAHPDYDPKWGIA